MPTAPKAGGYIHKASITEAIRINRRIAELIANLIERNPDREAAIDLGKAQSALLDQRDALDELNRIENT